MERASDSLAKKGGGRAAALPLASAHGGHSLAQITAERPVERLELFGFVVMKKSTGKAHSTPKTRGLGDG
jgi:hypothetical protein